MIAFHVFAVFSAPWLIQLRDIDEPPLPPGRPWLVEDGRVVTLQQLDRGRHPPLRAKIPEAIAGPQSKFPLIYHYANALYINNGYDFFSPDPTGSFILRYQVLDSMGQPIKEGRFPDRDSQWPRLLYHRYMMLADQSAAAPQEQGAVWMQKVADRLLARYHGASVKLTSVRHHLLMPNELLAGQRIDEASTYQVLNEGTFVASLPDPAATTPNGAAAQGVAR
jgi:hypothetical protein